ncbi:MAG: hypothetical protein JXN59_10930 [Anaerolineae bacterium]|nr:hypothetical protein [Anaerolineae bacterium]
MPDPRDGKITAQNTEKEPQGYAFAHESPDPAAGEHDPSVRLARSAQAAGESTDVIDDAIQEQGEDNSAAEEEAGSQVNFQQESPATPHRTESAAIRGSSAYPDRSAPHSTREHEAGESPDAIKDSTQFGHDNLADRAEELSSDNEDDQQIWSDSGEEAQ